MKAGCDEHIPAGMNRRNVITKMCCTGKYKLNAKDPIHV